MRALVSGYYGFGNLGDEAILSVLLELLRARLDLSGEEVCVLSGTPQDTARIHGVRAVPRTSPRAIRRELARSDVFVSGGGGLIQDRTSRRSAAYYLGLLEWARHYAPIVLMGQGIGPLESVWTQRWAHRILPRADAALVRDEASARLLRRWNVPADRLFCGSDLTLLKWKSASPTDEACAPLQGHLSGPGNENDEADGASYAFIALRGRDVDPSSRQLVEAIRALSERRNVRPALLAMHPAEDLAPLERLAGRLPIDAPVLDPTGVATDDVLRCFRSADVVIGSRLHALVFALLSRRPFVALGGGRKVTRFLREVAEVGGPDVPQLVLGGRPARSIKLAEAVEALEPWNERWAGAAEALARRTERAVDGFIERLASLEERNGQ